MIIIIFFTSILIIFWAMIGYPLSLKLLKKFYKNKKPIKDYNYEPFVTIMVVAHNEEKVIKNKLINLTEIDYPSNKLEILVASDNSTDETNQIVLDFIKNNKKNKIRLFKVKERKGKTNGQNEAQKTVTSEILVMTDANSMFEKNALRELLASFSNLNISYVTGRLMYVNDQSDVAQSESTYWDQDIQLRKIESDIQTITAGNGAIYACRNSEYVDFEPIKGHDSNMPRYYALKGKKAIFNPEAIATEKAGSTIEDEFKRKIRMNRRILINILPNIRILNIFKYRWYTYFYIGHRTCRYLLWISHLVLLISNIILVTQHWFYVLVLFGQLLFYLLAIIKILTKSSNKYLVLIYYYCITLLAQWVGVYNILTGKTKPFWEKAESTR